MAAEDDTVETGMEEPLGSQPTVAAEAPTFDEAAATGLDPPGPDPPGPEPPGPDPPGGAPASAPTIDAAIPFGVREPLPFAVTADAVTVGAASGSGGLGTPHPRTMRSGLPFAALASGAPGRYQLEAPLGEGGFGRVDAVWDAQLERSVAMKLLLDPETDDAVMKSAILRGREARFVNEARITGKLEHPGIVPVYELGRAESGGLYYVMRRVKGQDFEEALRRAAFRERIKLLPRLVDACNAVAYAHSRGVIHRDLKPDNVMLGEYGETLVVDWGLAKVKGEEDLQSRVLADGLEQLRHTSNVRTIEGQALGTPSYMPPEQCVGELDLIDERSDVYALGAVLYHLLTGHPPYSGDTVGEIIKATVRGELVPPREVEPLCPPELDAICVRALALDKELRYADAGALAADIQAFLDGGLVGAHRYSPQQRAARWLRENRWRLLAVAALVVGTGGAWLYATHDAEVRAEQQAAAAAHAKRAREQARRDELVAELDHILEDTARGSSTPRWLETYAFKIISLGEPVAASAIEAKLVRALEHSSRDVRRLAARSLSGLHRRYAVEALTSRLAEDQEEDDDVLIEIINALGVIGDARAEEAVAKARFRKGQHGPFWEQTKLAYTMIPLPALDDEGAGLTGEQWNDRGKALANKGRRDESILAYGKAIETAPDNPKGYNNRAIERARLERYDEALKDYAKAITLDPSGGMATRYNRAVLKRKIDDYQGAIDDYSALIELGFRVPMVLRGRAIAYRYLGRHDDAIADLERAIEEKVGDPRTHSGKATAYAEMHRWNDVVDEANRAIALNPDYVQALVMRSYANRMLGDLDAALADLDRAVDINPSSDFARVHRATLRLHRGDADGASEDISHCLDNPCPNKADRLGMRLFNRSVVWHAQQERWTQAHEDLERAFAQASARSDEVKIALAGLIVARRLSGAENAKTWRARLKDRPDPRFLERVLRVVHGKESYADLDADTAARTRRCLVHLAGGLASELAGDLETARERYAKAERVERPSDVTCILASVASHLGEE